MIEWMERPHRRLNPLTGEWVLVSPQRATRPWLGQVEDVPQEKVPAYDPRCYLCPGNERARGVRNPKYTSTFVFDNDFPALLPDPEPAALNERSILVAAPEAGVCRVICFSPRHDLSIPTMSREEVTTVIDTWCGQLAELRALPYIRYVQIFENRGSLMGASNPHPHCQIWACQSIPNELRKETESQRAYQAGKDTCLLCDYLGQEKSSARLICENDSFAALIPFWAVWPFEAMIVGKRHFSELDQSCPAERIHLAEILGNLTRAYDRLFKTPFPYSMGFHQRPKDSEAGPEAWHLHAHFYPPLLRSAQVRKFMVGFELLSEPQRDITPEAAAARLRELVRPPT